MLYHFADYSEKAELREKLRKRAEFDVPVIVWPDGAAEVRPSMLPVPESIDGNADALTDGSAELGWSLLTGFSGQYGYSGPVMHASEFIGGDLAAYILTTPGVYVSLIAYYDCSADSCDGFTPGEPCEDYPHADGWGIAFRELAPEDFGPTALRDCPCCGMPAVIAEHDLCAYCNPDPDECDVRAWHCEGHPDGRTCDGTVCPAPSE